MPASLPLRFAVVRLRPLLLRAGGIFVAAVALFVTVRSFDLGSVAGAFERADAAWLLPALGIVVVQLVLRAIRLRSLLPTPDDGANIGVGSVATAMLVASLINNVSPARIGDGIKSYLISRRHRLPFSGVLGSIMLEHALDAPSLAVVAAVVVVWLGIGGALRAASLAAGVAGFAILGLLFTTDLARLGRRLRAWVGSRTTSSLIEAVARRAVDFGDGFRVVGRRRVVAVALILGVVAWSCDAVSLWLVARALGLPLSLPGAVLIGAAVALSTALPGAPGYVGTLELAVIGAAGAVGLAGPGTLALALVFHALQLVPLSVAGLLVLVVGGHRLPRLSIGELHAARALATSEVATTP